MRRIGFIKAVVATALLIGLPCSARMDFLRADAEEAQIVPTSQVVPTASSTGSKLLGDDKSSKSGKNAKPTAGFTPEREAAALTFVRQHHPELADLLERLKTRRPSEYQKAIRDLFRVSERLAQSSEQQPQKYELELQEWKAASRIQLLVARMSMNRTPEQDQELRQLLSEQLEIHRQLLKFNQERAVARANALSKELSDLEARRQDLIEERFAHALKSVNSKKPLKTATAAKSDNTKSETKNKPEKSEAINKNDSLKKSE